METLLAMAQQGLGGPGAVVYFTTDGGSLDYFRRGSLQGAGLAACPWTHA